MALITDENKDTDNSNRQKIVYGNKENGFIYVYITGSDFEIYGDFIPGLFDTQYLDITEFIIMLGRNQIAYGIQKASIEAALNQCNKKNQAMRNVLIAKGERPKPEISEVFVLNPHLKKGEKAVDKRARINYREHSPFVIVKKGQILARLKPKIPGKPGRTVRGETLPFEIIRPDGIVGGENTRTESDKIIAEIHGQLIETKRVVSVQENLVIKGAVGYRTGHISFPGDVQINGAVSDGFKIHSGGSLTIKQTLDLTEVVTKGDIHVVGGIIGKGPALLKSGGGIKTKFIENCNAAVRNLVQVDLGIVNSSIYTLNSVEMSDKGKIIGSEIYAVHGLRTGRIGKVSTRATRIYCGIDFTAQQEKEKCNNQLRVLAAKLSRLEEMMEGPNKDPETLEKMEELRQRLRSEQRAATSRISELLAGINANEKAVVEVVGEIAPGTFIEICQISLTVNEPLRKVRIRLEKSSKRLVAEPL